MRSASRTVRTPRGGAAPLTGLVLIMMTCFANIAAAQARSEPAVDAPPTDRVWIAPPAASDSGWYPEAIEIRRGRVTAFDDQQLTLVPAGDDESVSVAAERVLWIEPSRRSQQERAALRDFRERHYGAALRPLIESLESRPAVWRQQWLLMAAAQAAWRASRPSVALELVRQLDQRPLPPLVLAWLPVAWRSERLSPADQQTAAASLADSSPAVRLVAASWLLASADRERAKQVLGQLAVAEDRPRIAQLAEAVLWRAALPDEALAAAEPWQRQLEALPLVLQVGPTVTLIEKLRAAGADGGIVEHWQWSLELTPPHPHPDLPPTSGAAD